MNHSVLLPSIAERRALPAVAWNLLLDLFYPPRCGGCDRRGTLLCEDCLASMIPPENPYFVAPGLSVISAGVFGGPLREAVHKLKYEGDLPLARPLARLLAAAIAGSLDEEQLLETVIVPVPLHRRREKARGYNQSARLANELARLTGLPVAPYLARVRHTESQVGKSADARRVNVDGAFQWAGGTLPRRVLLVDDVCTTGATLLACASALREAGTLSVRAATVARAVFGDSLDV